MNASATTRSPLTWPQRRDGYHQAHQLAPDGRRTLCGMLTCGDWIQADPIEVTWERRCAACDNTTAREYDDEPEPSEWDDEVAELTPARRRSYDRLRGLLYGHEVAMGYQRLTPAETARFRASTQRGIDPALALQRAVWASGRAA